MVTWKQFVIYWRTPQYIVGRTLITAVTALVFGATWWQEGNLPDGGYVQLSNVQNIIGSMYAGMSFTGMTNLLAGVPVFHAEREVATRYAFIRRGSRSHAWPPCMHWSALSCMH